MVCQRSTPQLITAVRELVGEGLHTTFRKFCDHHCAQGIWLAIDRMSGEQWSAICEAVADTVIAFVLNNPKIRRSARSESRLAFNIARRSMQVIRHLSRTLPAEKTSQIREYLTNVNEMTFSVYRESLGVLADTLLSAFLTPRNRCVDCAFRKERDIQCETCRKPACEFHCLCSAGKLKPEGGT